MSILTLLLFGFVFLLIIHYILNNTYVVELLEKKKHPSLDMDEDTLIEHHMFYNYNKLESLQFQLEVLQGVRGTTGSYHLLSS